MMAAVKSVYIIMVNMSQINHRHVTPVYAPAILLIMWWDCPNSICQGTEVTQLSKREPAVLYSSVCVSLTAGIEKDLEYHLDLKGDLY